MVFWISQYILMPLYLLIYWISPFIADGRVGDFGAEDLGVWGMILSPNEYLI